MREALRKYWGVKYVPGNLFMRDKLFHSIDGNTAKVKLDCDEVLGFIANGRLNPPPPKNGASGSS
jgi:hypothetical protein